MPKPKQRGNITIWVDGLGTDENNRRPEYRGYVTVDGEELEISLWINGTVGGVPTKLSGQVQEKYEGGSNHASPKTEGDVDDFSDDIPF